MSRSGFPTRPVDPFAINLRRVTGRAVVLDHEFTNGNVRICFGHFIVEFTGLNFLKRCNHSKVFCHFFQRVVFSCDVFIAVDDIIFNRGVLPELTTVSADSICCNIEKVGSPPYPL